MNKYQLVDYFDVWKDRDGWQVNDLCRVGEPITISDDATDSDIIDYLKQIHFLGENANEENVRVEWIDEFFVEFFEDATDLPLGRLERI